MAYATLQDIKDEVPNVPLSASSKPSESQIVAQIDLIESHVNSVLQSRGYTVPITGGPESLKLLRKIVRHGVAAEVMRVFTGGGRMMGESSGMNEHQRIYDALLANVVLPDATSGPTVDLFMIGSYPASGSEDEYIAFERGQVF